MKQNKTLKKIERTKIHNIDKLLLWHNNPRLIEEFGEERSMSVIESCQEEISERLMQEGSVVDLMNSILSNGWLGYDPILVATIEGGKKYVVLEGNRRVTALKKIIERAKQGTLTDNDELSFDEEDIQKQIKKEGLEVFNAGEFETFPKEREELVKKILNVRHIISQNPWPLHRKAFQVFKDYMKMLAQNDPSVIDTEPKSFYLSENLADILSSNMGEKSKEIRNYLYIHRLRTQLDNALSKLGSEFPKDKTSYLEEFLGRPDLRRRYGFDGENGTISRGEYMERFCSVFFEYPGNEPAIKAAASGDSSLRDYAWVVKNDPTENKEEFIRMIEEDKQQSSLVKSLVVHQLGEFELERGLENIYNMIEKIKLGNIGIEHFDSDRTRELVELILDRFSAVESKYKKWKENQ